MADRPTPPEASPRRHGAAATRHAVLDAAEALFVRRGYAGTTITEIARHARVGTNTVYVGFGTKPGIVVALLERATEASSARDSLAAVPLARDGSEVIDEIARGTRATHEQFHDVVSLGLDTASVDPAIGEAQHAAIDEIGRAHV